MFAILLSCNEDETSNTPKISKAKTNNSPLLVSYAESDDYAEHIKEIKRHKDYSKCIEKLKKSRNIDSTTSLEELTKEAIEIIDESSTLAYWREERMANTKPIELENIEVNERREVNDRSSEVERSMMYLFHFMRPLSINLWVDLYFRRGSVNTHCSAFVIALANTTRVIVTAAHCLIV